MEFQVCMEFMARYLTNHLPKLYDLQIVHTRLTNGLLVASQSEDYKQGDPLVSQRGKPQKYVKIVNIQERRYRGIFRVQGLTDDLQYSYEWLVYKRFVENPSFAASLSNKPIIQVKVKDEYTDNF